jgi:hypothetical protein
LILGLSLLGCTEFGPLSDIPKPFQTEKGTFDMSHIVMADHIVIAPIEGLADTQGAALRALIAQTLVDRGIIATTLAPPQRTSTLRGKVTADPTPKIVWTLLDPDGYRARSFETPVSPSVFEEAPSSSPQMQAAARLVAENFNSARRLSAAPPKPSRARENPRIAVNEDVYGDVNLPTLFILPILGAPGDGNQELDAGIRRALRDQQVALVAAPGPEDFQLQCVVVLAPATGGASQISLYWELKTGQGESVASVDQTNLIESGSLDGSWGTTADLITQAAADSLVQFLAQATQNSQ